MPKMISSADVPQADKLSDVVRVVQAVGKGSTSFEGIASYIGKVDRQGRYYRRAAEILGWIERQATNESSLTPAGQALLAAGSAKQADVIAKSLASTAIFGEILRYLASKGTRGADRTELKRFMMDVAELGAPTMAPRRVATLTHWLMESGLAELNADGRYITKAVIIPPDEGIEQIPDEKQIISGKEGLRDFKAGSKKSQEQKGIIQVLVDEAKKERANKAHQQLVEQMADLLNKSGSKPKANRFVDLAASIEETTYLFEMKSITEENCVSQTRRGVSQLYEYRYLQDMDDAVLVLVLETKIPLKFDWLVNYLLEDRDIIPVWRDGDRFVCPDEAINRLPFL